MASLQHQHQRGQAERRAAAPKAGVRTHGRQQERQAGNLRQDDVSESRSGQHGRDGPDGIRKAAGVGHVTRLQDEPCEGGEQADDGAGLNDAQQTLSVRCNQFRRHVRVRFPRHDAPEGQGAGGGERRAHQDSARRAERHAALQIERERHHYGVTVK